MPELIFSDHNTILYPFIYQNCDYFEFKSTTTNISFSINPGSGKVTYIILGTIKDLEYIDFKAFNNRRILYDMGESTSLTEFLTNNSQFVIQDNIEIININIQHYLIKHFTCIWHKFDFSTEDGSVQLINRNENIQFIPISWQTYKSKLTKEEFDLIYYEIDSILNNNVIMLPKISNIQPKYIVMNNLGDHNFYYDRKGEIEFNSILLNYLLKEWKLGDQKFEIFCEEQLVLHDKELEQFRKGRK